MSRTLSTGFIQVYTGNGKGKTTAALGLIVRAIGAGANVFLGQFAKHERSSEIDALELLASNLHGNRLVCETFGATRIVGAPLQDADVHAARTGFNRAVAVLRQAAFDVVVLDEINFVLGRGLLKEDDFQSLLDARPDSTELVLTGRHAPQYVIETADLVSMIESPKHYFRKGVKARAGIEF